MNSRRTRRMPASVTRSIFCVLSIIISVPHGTLHAESDSPLILDSVGNVSLQTNIIRLPETIKYSHSGDFLDTRSLITLSDSSNGINGSEKIQRRTVFTSLTSGFIEFLCYSVGYQMSDDWSVAPGVNIIIAGNHYVTPEVGFCLAVSWYLDISNKYVFINNVTVKPTIVWQTFNQYVPRFGLNGSSLEVSIGYESIERHHINISWSAGYMVSVMKTEKPLYFPCFKLGLYWNF